MRFSLMIMILGVINSYENKMTDKYWPGPMPGSLLDLHIKSGLKEDKRKGEMEWDERNRESILESVIPYAERIRHAIRTLQKDSECDSRMIYKEIDKASRDLEKSLRDKLEYMYFS